MKLDPDKCYLVLGDSDIKIINVGDFTIKSIKSEKLLGVTSYNKCNCQSHIENLYCKANSKLHALARIALIWICEKKTLMNAFFELQFGYCPLL